MKNMKKRVGLALIAFGLTGCASNQEIYHWGAYEGVVRNMYVEPGSVPAQVQIAKLSRDIQRSESRGKRVPPGLYAHLAMAYAADGQPARSREALEREKQLFPESTVLVDTLINNQQAGAQK